MCVLILFQLFCPNKYAVLSPTVINVTMVILKKQSDLKKTSKTHVPGRYFAFNHLGLIFEACLHVLFKNVLNFIAQFSRYSQKLC